MSKADNKKTLIVGLLAFVHGKPPPLEDDTRKGTPTKAKVEPPTPTEKATAQGAETKVNANVSKMLRREFKIHGVAIGDIFKDRLSFVSLARQI